MTSDKSYATEQRLSTLVVQAGIVQVSGNVTLSNAAFTSIFAGMTVTAGNYLAKADLLIPLGSTATALILQLTGPAVASNANVKWRLTNEAATGTFVYAGHSIGSLSSVTLPSGTTFSATSIVHVWLSAYLPFTAGGTLNLQAQLGTASATSQVSQGSTLQIRGSS